MSRSHFVPLVQFPGNLAYGEKCCSVLNHARYDLAGDLLSESYPSGRTVSTSYDIAMRPISNSGVQGSTTTNYVQQVGYWPHGAIYYWQYGNNVWPVENYSPTLQPSIDYATVANSSSQFLLYLQNVYNTDSTVNSIVEQYGPAVPASSLTNVNQFLTYDHIKRLTNISDTGYTRGFQYDAYGNLSLASNSGVPLSGMTPLASQNPYNAANNRLIEATYNDARGNMTAVGAVSSMSYDGESRQVQTVDSGQTTTYAYDGLGQRAQRQITGGATTVYVHDAFGQMAAEYNSAGVNPACTTCYLTYDQIGSTRLITDQNHNVVARHDFLPYGEEVPVGQAGRAGTSGFGNTATVTQMFTGQERDGGTATLDYFNARHLSAVLGSFTQPDPMNAGANVAHPQSWNAYAYVLGNPLGLVDPSGRCSVKDGQTAATDDPGSPCVSSANSSVTVDGGAPDNVPTNDTSPWELGWQWVTGTGPKGQIFGPGAAMTKKLQQHTHVQLVQQAICSSMQSGKTPPTGPVSANYGLGGMQGVPKYFADYSTLLTGGATGNLAVTYLGSYAMTYNVTAFDMASGTATVQFHVSNTSTVESATHPPVVGYTAWWGQNIGQPLNNFVGQSGPLSPTTQAFYWTGQLNGCQAK